MRQRVYILFYSLLVLLATSCRKQLNPELESSVSQSKAVADVENLKASTNGVYALLNSSYLLPHYFRLTSLSTDDAEVISSSNTQVGTNIQIYTYDHNSTMSNVNDFWRYGYATIFAANRIINSVGENETDSVKRQLKAENLAIRALMHIYLTKIFGRSYADNNGANPGVPYLTTADPNTLPSRNSVKEVYARAIDDLNNSISLFKVNKPNSAIGKYACYSILSTLYLDMDDNANAIAYADLVINSNLYQLVTGGNYINYFNKDHSQDNETIFALRNLDTDSKFQLGYSGDYAFSNFAAASPSLLKLLFETDSMDLRKNFFIPKTLNGRIYFFVNKFMQAGDITVYSPPLIRLSEVYLNRAEAYARIGNTAAAIADVNIIRKRAGLINPSYLYTTTNLLGRSNILNVVLDERRLELAFENGVRRDDLWRNRLPMVRNYLNAVIPGGVLTINPESPRRVFYIPQNEMNLNLNLIQNP